jgi:hypothetical protein
MVPAFCVKNSGKRCGYFECNKKNKKRQKAYAVAFDKKQSHREKLQ